MKRILLVEDSPTQAARLRLLLARENYDVAVATTGEEGLEQARARPPDLVVSDVTMPKMDGFEMCRILKSADDTRRIPVILLTSRTSPADIITGLESGADNFIPKPYDDDYLLERVRRIFEQLELRARATLDMEVVLTVGGRKITVTADRQQIIELLFSTFEQMSRNFDELAEANKQLQEARVEADRANRAKSQFLSRMSHELRTPLNAIIGFAHLLELSDLAPQDVDAAQTIGRAGRHLLDLINDLLDIGRIEADEMSVNLGTVSVAQVHDEIMELVRPLSSVRAIRMDAEPPSPELQVVADRPRLKQVLLNLLSNAIKYNRENGSVLFRWAAVGDRVRAEVADTGIGIAAADIDRLFSPFDRIGAEGKSDVEGTGLGLAVSKRLVDAMNGTLTVESQPNVGSTFCVDLPRAQLDAGTVRDGAATPPGSGG